MASSRTDREIGRCRVLFKNHSDHAPIQESTMASTMASLSPSVNQSTADAEEVAC